jgi:hypothetical protein
MTGYVVGGYVVAIGSLASYGLSVARRERTARIRARGRFPQGVAAPSPLSSLLEDTPPEAEWTGRREHP